MTIIAVAHGLVLADSARDTIRGREYVPGKIFKYEKPVQMRSTRQGFKDWFYGFAGTGEDEMIKHCGDMALCGQLDLWLDRYKHVDEMRFLNDLNSFSVLLFGLEGNALLEVNSGNIVLQYHPHTEVASVAIGSGAAAFHRLFNERKFKICPVRAMYGTFAMEPTCGGEVEVWRLPTAVRGKDTGFKKLGTFPHHKLVDCFRMAASPNKFHYKEESKEWLKSLILRLAKRSPKQFAELASKPSLTPWESLSSRSKKPPVASSSLHSRLSLR